MSLAGSWGYETRKGFDSNGTSIGSRCYGTHGTFCRMMGLGWGFRGVEISRGYFKLMRLMQGE